MIKHIILTLKGFLIGLSLIIPGVSGGTMAVILGVYEKLIEILSNVVKKIKENIFFLLFLCIGIILSVILGSIVLEKAFESFILPTTLLFAGLIIGGLPLIFKKAKPGIKKPTNYIYFILTVGLILFVTFATGENNPDAFNEINIGNILLLFVLGIIAAATMIVPGISGSLVLMLLGYYEAVLGTISDLTNFNNLGHNLAVLVPFLLGALVGIITFAKLINFLLARFSVQTFFGILGFVIASIFGICYGNFKDLSLGQTELIWQLVIGFILLIGGAIGTYFMSRNHDDDSTKESTKEDSKDEIKEEKEAIENK